MTDKTYKIGTNIYDIPETEVESFLSDNPNAVEIESYKIDKDTFDIPVTERESFLKDFPTAQPLKKKVETISEESTIPSEPSTKVQQLLSSETKPERQPVRDLFRSLKSSSFRALGGIAATPMLINRTLASVTMKPIIKLMGGTDEEAEAAFQAMLASNTFGQSVRTMEEVQKPLTNAARKTEEKMAQLEGTIWTNLTRGEDGKKDLGVALELFGRGLVGSVPYIAMTAATAGAGTIATLGVIGSTAAAQQYGETGEMDERRLLNAWMYGGFEAVGELATAYILRGVGKTFRQGMIKQIPPKSVSHIAKGVATAVGLESSSEAITQIGQNFTAIVTGEDPNRSLLDHTLDAAFIGGGVGLIGGGGGRVGASALGRAMASDKEVETVQENTKQQEVLINQVEQTENKPVKKALDKTLREIKLQSDAIMDENYVLAKQLTLEQQNQVAELYSVWNELQDKIDNKQVTEQEVPTIEKTIEGIKGQIQTIKEDLITRLEEEKKAKEAKEAKGKEGEKKKPTTEIKTAVEELIEKEVPVPKPKVEPIVEEPAKEIITPKEEIKEEEDAERIRRETEEAGRKEEMVEGEEERLRLRDAEKDRLEAVTGEEVRPIKAEEIPAETKIGVTEPITPLEMPLIPPTGEKPAEVPLKLVKGIKYKDKVYIDVDDVAEDFGKFDDFKEYNKVLEQVRNFEGELRNEANINAKNAANKIGIRSKADEEKIVRNYKNTKNRLTVKILPPDIPALINDVAYKQLVKLRDGLADGVAGILQQGMKSQNDILRWFSKTTTNWFGGLGRTQFDIHGGKGKIGKLEMKGTAGTFAEYKAKQVRQKMLDLVNSERESLERVWSVLDPELSETTLKYDDLTPTEKNLYDLVNDWNTWVWNTNYTLGIIPTASHLKFQGEDNKTTYIARMYDTHEIELMPPEIEEHIKKGSNSVTTKMITDYLHARKEVDDYKKEHAIKDPTYLTSKRIMQTIQNVAVKEYMDAVIEAHPDFVLDIKKGEETPSGYTKLGSSWSWGGFRNKAVINHVVEDFTGFYYATKLTNLAYDALKLWDRNGINQFYKKFRTLFNPMVQVGNMTGNVFFASINGINPAEFIAEEISVVIDRTKNIDEPIYESLLKSGLMGDTGITGDMTPPKDIIVNKLLKKNVGEDINELYKEFSNLAGKIYVGSDNVAKYAAYGIYRKRGFTHEQALRRAYDAFQNYTTVGKSWDVASKIPVVGPTFVKFQADLQRIILNSLLTTPLTAIGTVMLIKMLGNLASNLSGEDEEKKKEREKRKGVAKIPIVNVPLSFKVGKSEINVARYFSPLYIYKREDSETDLSELSKYLPLQFSKTSTAQLGEKKNVIAFSDATWGWLGSVMADRDFRSMSIKNPKATIFSNPNISDMQRRVNQINYILRSQLPFYKSVEDITDGFTGKLDYYGRKRTWYQSIINGIIKIQEFDDPELRNYMQNNIDYLTSKYAGLSKSMGDANNLYLKEVERAGGLNMSAKALERLKKDEDGKRMASIDKSLKEQIPVLDEIERLSSVYKRWWPQDEFVKKNYFDIEDGRNKIFDVRSDIDFQKKYKKEYDLLRSYNLLNQYKPEIPKYINKKQVTPQQRQNYIATFWSEYIRQLDMRIGLEKDDFEKAKTIMVDERETTQEPEPIKITRLQEQASKSAQNAKKLADSQLEAAMSKK